VISAGTASSAFIFTRGRGALITDATGPDSRGRSGQLSGHEPEEAVLKALKHPDRLAALHRTALLDTLPEEAFDRVTRLVIRTLHAPVALVSLVDEERQFFKSAIGLPHPWSERRETPLTHSFCKHVVASGQPLLVEDSGRDPRVRDHPAVRELGVAAYLGVPLVSSDGFVVGALCAIDTEPRRWMPEQLAVLEDLAAVVMTEIELRSRRTGRRTAS